MSAGTTRPRVDTYQVRVWAADPRAVRLARSLGVLHGRGIRGETGTTRYGYPAIGTRRKFGGYVSPPQLFIGYDPRKVARGAFRGAPGGLPSTSSAAASSSPLARAMATVTQAQLGGA